MTIMRSVILAILSLPCWASALSAAELSDDQRLQVLQEAVAAYEQGQHSSSSDIAAAKDAFATAAQKYRLLIDSGITNAHLYQNLGNASLQSGRLGEAIAAYEHAAVLAPSDSNIRRHLEYARSLHDGDPSLAETDAMLDQLAEWNQSVPMSFRLVIGLLMWSLIWAGLTGWLVSGSPTWRRTTIAAGIVAAVAIASIGCEWSRMPHTAFGIVTTSCEVRTANGEMFPPVLEEPLSSGSRFDLVERRGDWLHVRLTDGKVGWIPDHTADVIIPADSLRG